MKRLTCDDCRMLLSDALSGELDPGLPESMEAHLAGCKDCRATAQELVWQDLAISELAGKSRTGEILGRFRNALVSHKARVRRPVRRRSIAWAVTAAASVLVGAAILLSLDSRDPVSPPPSSAPAVVVETSEPPVDLPEPYRAKVRPVETAPHPEPKIEPEPRPVVPNPPAPTPKSDPPAPKPPVVKPPAPAPPPSVKPVTRPAIAKVIYSDGTDVVPGKALLEGSGLEVEENAGVTKVAFPDGTLLELRRNTSVSRLSARKGKRVVVERGTVLARVAPQPKGSPMIFETPQGEATVLGTTLRIVVGSGQENATRLEVREGRVRLKRKADGRSVVLSTGQYAIASPGKPMTRRKILPPLQELATSMGPGSWAELETDGFGPAEILVKPWMTALVDTEEALWDPVGRQLHVVGYTSQDGTAHFVYDERGNRWQRKKADKATSWYGPGYDHLAFQPATRTIYFRQHNHDLVHGLDVGTGTWTSLPRMPSNPAAIGALEYFPEMDGLVFAGGGAVYVYRFRSKRWDVLAQGLEVGPSDAITEYDPVHRIMLIGGGQGNRSLYRLDPSGTVSQLRQTPIALGLKDALVVTDPAGGKMLVLSRPDGERFFEYDVLSDRWTKLEKPPVAVMPNTRRAYTTAAQIPRWGVVMYLVADEKESHVYLYRHGRSRR